MNRVMKALFPFLFGFLVVFPGLCYGVEGEEEIFTIKIEPDALIVLDLSGSMTYPPPGEWGYSEAVVWVSDSSYPAGGYNKCTGERFYGTSQGAYKNYCKNKSTPGQTYKYAVSEDCSGPYYKTSSGMVDCSRKVIAQKAIYTLLDDDQSGKDKKYISNKIDKQDELSLGVRLGYMSFFNCGSTFTWASHDSDYNGGCNVLRQGLPELKKPAPSKGYYRTIYESVTADINNAGGKTPLAGAMDEARSYLEAHKAGDDAKACRSKFVIFITDGWDTLACGADPDHSPVETTKGWSYKRRRATVTAAKALHDAGYKVFMIGFGGDMPTTLVNTLNWAAYYGGTDNPSEDNYENGVLISGKPSSLSALSSPDTEEAVCTSDFKLTTENCTTLGNQLGDDCCSNVGKPSAPDCCNKAPNDPGFKDLTGYAFIAYSTDALNTALQTAINYIEAARYSFTVASVSAARVQSGNFLYEASFIPYVGFDPFWQGHLKKFKINDSGKVVQPAVLDAGDVLRDRAASRNMYTYLGGTIKPFITDNITPTLLGLSSTDTAGRDKVVGYFRGESATYTQEKWRLGDIFHSNPVTIDPPSIYFNDTRSWNAFDSFRQTNKSREWLVVLGANDGQIHAFSTGDLAEKWSFIPPNLLPKLQLISHATEPAPSTMNHQFYVDGPVTVADVWLGSGDGYSKTADKWATLMIVGLGKGVRESDSDDDPDFLWSSSPSCDSNLRRKHHSKQPHYCGYWAFDVTNTSATNPTLKWRLNATSYSSHDPKYLDEPWSKMAIGRVKIGGDEKWVGLIGGGYNVKTEYKEPKRGDDYDDLDTKGKRGKGFFVVDLSNGNILWSYTQKNNSDMDYCVPASPLVLDWDNDGFIDTAYISDLGGNVWRFRFCSLADGASCNTSNWQGSRLFDSTGVARAVFSTPSVAMDASSQLWVFWGTGNKLKPRTDTSGQDRFFAVKDKDFTSTFKVTDLQKLTTQAYGGTMAGWYIEFPSSGEKMLFDSSVFGGMVLFTTYTPTTGTDPCANSGIGRLYALAMMPITIDGVTYNAGAGLMSKPADTASKDGGNKSISLGAGMPTAPLLSQKPKEKPGATDLFVPVSGGGATDTAVTALGDLFTVPEPGKPCPPGTPPALCRLAQTPPQAQIIHWRDRRLLQ